MSAQAQKFEIFEKSSLWVSVVRATKKAFIPATFFSVGVSEELNIKSPSADLLHY
jgi:hypothetical protein